MLKTFDSILLPERFGTDPYTFGTHLRDSPELPPPSVFLQEILKVSKGIKLYNGKDYTTVFLAMQYPLK